jgi:hypothetical protein
VPDDILEQFGRTVSDKQLVVVSAEGDSSGSSVGRFVDILLYERYSKGFQVGVPIATDHGHHAARIEAAAQEYADRDVGDHPQPDGIAEQFQELLFV